MVLKLLPTATYFEEKKKKTGKFKRNPILQIIP